VSLIAFGLNHRTSPLSLLEAVTVPAEGRPKLLARLNGSGSITGVVVLSTCNRIEIYVDAERFHDSFEVVRDALVEIGGVDPSELGTHLAARYEQEVVEHLFGVTCGLDSAVLGEHEILGQTRDAWQLARAEESLTPALDRLFQRAVEIGKRVRTDTAIGRGTVSLAHAAVQLADSRLAGLQGRRLGVLGAGVMASTAAAGLAANRPAELVVLNRNPRRADDLAAGHGGRGAPLSELEAELASLDAVIVAVAAPDVVVSRQMLERAVSRRGSRPDPLVIVDLGLPRNVAPEAREVPGIVSCDLDDLRRFADDRLADRRRAADEAAELVLDAVLRFQSERSARRADPLIAGLRGWAEQVRRAEIARHSSRFGDLDPRAEELVDAVTRALLGKLLHGPTVALKTAAGTSRGDRLAEALAELFALDQD